MKPKLSFLLGCFFLLVSADAFSQCGGSSGCVPPPPYRGYVYASCSSGPYDSDCQCTDPNCGKNPCLSRSRCCEAFGNVGGR